MTTVVAGREALFLDLSAARAAIHEMRRMQEEQRLFSLAWMLMPDHLHWLFQLGDGQSLARVMHDFKGRSAHRVNGFLGRTGRLWQRAYHDHAVRADEDILAIARYLVANPIRAGLADHVGDYPHWDVVWL